MAHATASSSGCLVVQSDIQGLVIVEGKWRAKAHAGLVLTGNRVGVDELCTAPVCPTHHVACISYDDLCEVLVCLDVAQHL